MFSTITYNNGFLEEETMGKELCNDRPKKRLACLECRARKVRSHRLSSDTNKEKNSELMLGEFRSSALEKRPGVKNV